MISLLIMEFSITEFSCLIFYEANSLFKNHDIVLRLEG